MEYNVSNIILFATSVSQLSKEPFICTLFINWSATYNSLNPVSELNKVITFLIDSLVPSKVIKRKVNDKAWFNEDCVNAFHNKQNAE